VRLPGHHQGKLPAQVEGVVDGKVHALRTGRTVDVRGIADEEGVAGVTVWPPDSTRGRSNDHSTIARPNSACGDSCSVSARSNATPRRSTAQPLAPSTPGRQLLTPHLDHSVLVADHFLVDLGRAGTTTQP
jgi:hypothetical protein